MSRRADRVNVEWETPEKNYDWDHAAIEVLMDIRAELRGMHQLMRCYRVPRALDAVVRLDRRLAKRIKLKA